MTPSSPSLPPRWGVDLISRMDAVQATRIGPSDEWSKACKDGYTLAATDCMMHILALHGPTEADLDRAAMARPKVAKLVDAVEASWAHDGEPTNADIARILDAIAALKGVE